MKIIRDFLKGCCAYTVVILAFFYILAEANNFGEQGIPFGRFALIFLFGAITAAAEYIFLIKINRVISVALHYCVLLFSFSMIFIASGVLGSAGSKIFVAIIVFTLLYAALFAAIYFAKLGIKALDERIDRRLPQKNEIKNKQKGSYQPRFKG